MSGFDLALLAIDAGGSNTRAVVVNAEADCLGYGVSTSGNPTAVGVAEALGAIGAAARRALAQAGLGPGEVTRVVLAAAGEEGLLGDTAVRAALGIANGAARVDRVVDILAMYHSAAVEPDGVALVAGTGAIAARFSRLEMQRVVDGTGWLLGDRGSGFWIGRKVARAVAADLDGAGPATDLTALVLTELGLPLPDGALATGRRPVVLESFLHHVYGDRPVRLARFAPYAFRAAAADEAAAAIVAEAEASLARTLRLARAGHEELPVVLGGSVVVQGILGPGRTPTGALAEELAGADVRRVHEGAAGAAVVGLLTEELDVSAGMLDRLLVGIAARRGA
ncbi:BadF/BadG/BcrA/BcrD ATPase family protein [Micromonospora sp. LZ34]